MSIKITQDNYPTYKKVFEIISQRLHKDFDNILSPDANPVNVLNSWDTKSMSLARRGLQTGLNDYLSSLNHSPKEMLADINTALEESSLPNIKELSGVIHKTLRQVAKTGKIKSIDQYYILKELLDKTVSEISPEERNSLSDSLGNYERANRR